jgi:hypothetical protein
MNLEQLSTMTEAELQAKANEHLERLDVPMVVSSATETHMPREGRRVGANSVSAGA